MKEYEQQIQTLSQELELVSERLRKSEKIASEPDPLLVQLSQEMSDMRKQHADAIFAEQKRANEAEEQLRSYSSLEEKRIAELGKAQLIEIIWQYWKK